MPLDTDVLSELYDRNAGALLVFFARRTLDPEAAVDLVAETFAVAFEDRAQFRGTSDETARAWLYAVARRRLFDFYRRGRIEQRAVRRLAVERRELTNEEYDRIEELAASRSLRLAVRDALATLSRGEREVLRLRVVEERPYREVARELGITEQTARARVSRALRALRASMTTPLLTEVPDSA